MQATLEKYFDNVHSRSDKVIEARFYADDLIIRTIHEQNRNRAFQIVKQWGKEFDIEINVKKSGVFEVKVDQRTPKSIGFSLEGIPLLLRFKVGGPHGTATGLGSGPGVDKGGAKVVNVGGGCATRAHYNDNYYNFELIEY